MNDDDSRERGLVLLLSCKNQPGIVAAISTHLYEGGCNIRASQQFDDVVSGRLFARLEFEPVGNGEIDAEQASEAFAPLAERFQMDWSLRPADLRMRVLIMVSRYGHCLNDLLYRASIGALRIEIPAIISNHADLAPLAAHYNIPFHHVPVTQDTKSEAEGQLLDLIAKEKVELTVLARYMQILSPELCHALSRKAINIHHSMLPSFKGARPYAQAHQRGVKLIGATAHYVTAELDEGPIIEQDVERVDHTRHVEDLMRLGQDVERRALARAVRWHAEHRVLLDGHRTIVFR